MMNKLFKADSFKAYRLLTNILALELWKIFVFFFNIAKYCVISFCSYKDFCVVKYEDEIHFL